jgi:hypothetical protein
MELLMDLSLKHQAVEKYEFGRNQTYNLRTEGQMLYQLNYGIRDGMV